MLRCAFARRLSIQMRFRCAQMSSRSTLVDPNEFPKCSDALSLDACRSKRVSATLKRALARRLSVKMHVRSVEMRSRSTPVDPNAFPSAHNVFPWSPEGPSGTNTRGAPAGHFGQTTCQVAYHSVRHLTSTQGAPVDHLASP